MTLQKKDFVEFEFTGKLKDGSVFDSNIKEDLKKIDSKAEAKPLVVCLGEGMFLKSIEDFLIGKSETPASYELELLPEKAFGARNPSFIQTIPIKVFHQNKMNPVPGNVFSFDGRLAKVLTASGGRVIADFNHPLAGKIVIYKIKLIRKLENLNEKIKAFSEFLFKKPIDFQIKDKKLMLEVEKPMVKFVELFEKKYKDIFDLDFEVKEKVEKPEKKEALQKEPKPLQ